jgi:hypothetical protein
MVMDREVKGRRVFAGKGLDLVSEGGPLDLVPEEEQWDQHRGPEEERWDQHRGPEGGQGQHREREQGQD